MPSHLAFEMNSAVKKNSSPMLNSMVGFFDHDLFVVLVIGSLFDIKQINQIDQKKDWDVYSCHT